VDHVTWLLALLTRNPLARAIGAALVALAGIWGYGAARKRQGASQARSEAAAKAAQRKIETMQTAKRVRDEVDAKTDAAVRGELRKWLRPD
jgi:HAMP domain-containing protein